jgi:DNA replication and repair protein RecF
MRQRNRLLEENGEAAWLNAIEGQMAELAAAMHFARADSLGHLQRLAAASVDETAFPAVTLALTPLFEDAHEPAASSLLENELLHLWRDTRGRDRAAGRTLVGPHRVDLEVTHTQKHMPAHLCSTGEQKALLIGMVLAHARLVRQMTGLTPFLLLDEVAAHLDPNRRAALFAALDGLETQCWMTGTDPMLFDDLETRAQRFFVHDGRVAPA